MPKALGLLATRLARAVQKRRLEKQTSRDYYQQLYAAQGPKAILLEAGRKEVLGQPLAALMLPDFADPLVKELKRQARLGAINESALVPSVLPLQILRLGPLALVCAPGEFTTNAGRRLRESVQAVLQPQGVAQVLLCTCLLYTSPSPRD